MERTLHHILDAQRAGTPGVVAIITANQSPLSLAPSYRVFITESGTIADATLPVWFSEALALEARKRLEMKKSGLVSFDVADNAATPVGIQGGNMDVFFEVLAQPPRLIVVGAGHIAVPLCAMAIILDFAVTILDDRPEYANADRFPDAESICVGPYRDTLARVDLDGDTYIVLVTRGHVHDQACLEQVMESGVPYIGMIGSKRRVRTVMHHLSDQNYPAEKLERVYAPVGLDIGSETPAEIALSILGEIVAVRRGSARNPWRRKVRLDV